MNHGLRPLVKVAGVSKAFAGNAVLTDVDLDVRPGEIHALVGSNGSGKSTLIKILAGIYSADGGTLETDGDVRFVHQERSTFTDLSVSDNLELGRRYETGPIGYIRRKAVRARAQAVLTRFNVDADPDALLGSLPEGAQTMVAIARALQDQPETGFGVLVLDEPTAALPPEEAEPLLRALRGYADRGQAIVFVSHRLEEVLQVADRITVLRDGRRVAVCSRDEVDHDGLVELIVGRALIRSARTQAGRHADETVLRTQGLRGGSVRDVSLSISRGEVVGLAGTVDSGCSALLRLVYGAQPIESGEMTVDGVPTRFRSPREAMRAGVAYVPADRARQAVFGTESLKNNLTIATLSRYWKGGRLRHRQELAEVRQDMSTFSIQAASPAQPVVNLSGGNQQKVVLARWLRRQPRLILLDEPTQAVDVGARGDLWAAIRAACDQGAAVLVASSDLEELAQVCDRVAIVRDGTIAHQVDGDITSEHLVELLHSAGPTS
ncbi:MAG: ribose transport system ATP-binding protein [Thermoleophilaceae bacterium]|nr:ribose transport system ATP-binding protein [Thermoleophilaceae bacterium]